MGHQKTGTSQSWDIVTLTGKVLLSLLPLSLLFVLTVSATYHSSSGPLGLRTFIPNMSTSKTVHGSFSQNSNLTQTHKFITRIDQLCDCMVTTWIDDIRPMFNPAIWNHFKNLESDGICTNNQLESFQSAFWKRFGSAHPNIFSFEMRKHDWDEERIDLPGTRSHSHCFWHLYEKTPAHAIKPHNALMFIHFQHRKTIQDVKFHF